MTADRVNDLSAFRSFIDEQLADNGPRPTLEEALARWEYENSPEEEREATLRAIERGLEDLDAGRTEDAFAFVARMRQQLRPSVRP